jgi:hypothetical protein
MTFYIYAHYKTGEPDVPFYIGKGSGDRAYEKYDRRPHWKNVVAKYGYEVRILHDGLTEEEAFWIETKLIGMWGRADLGKGPLVNHTNGGEGASGQIQTEETKKQKSKKLMNHEVKPHVRQAIAVGMKGNTNGLGTKRNSVSKQLMSERQRGNKKRLGMKQTERDKQINREAHSKTWLIIDPIGKVHTIFGLLEFCTNHSIGYRSMRRAADTMTLFRGYQVKRLL